MENNPGAVMVEAGFQTDKGPVKLTYRLTTGMAILELRPGEGRKRVRIEAPSRYLAVPDFFGDDMIFAPGQSARRRLRLPTENFLLHFVDPGGCLLMCVWQSSRQQAAGLLSGQSTQQVFEGSEIDCVAGKNLWIGVLEGPGIWHEQAVPNGDIRARRPSIGSRRFRPSGVRPWSGRRAAGKSWYFRGSEDGDEPISATATPSPCCLEAGQAVFHDPLLYKSGLRPTPRRSSSTRSTAAGAHR